jgi:hypothetical protein
MSRRGGGEAIEAKDFLMDDQVAAERASELVHVRNWLDCIKSREKPTSNVEVGFHSTLPTLLGRQAVKEGRALTWDPVSRTAKAV